MNRIVMIFYFLSLVITPFLGAQDIIETSAGQKVILKHVNRTTFAIAYVIPGGTANYDKNQQGIEQLALHWAAKGGVKDLPPAEFLKATDSLGIQIEVMSDYDFSTITFVGLKRHWAGSFELFKKTLNEPAFDESVFKNVKEELALEAYYMRQDGQTRLFLLAMENLFRDSDYHKIPQGSPSSIKQLEPEEVLTYFNQLRSRGNGFFVAAGDFNNSEREELVKFAGSQSVDQAPAVPNSHKTLPTSISINESELATNYLRGMIHSPKLTSEDGFPMLLGMEILSTRVFQRIRNEEGLSYGPSAFYANGIVHNPYSVIQMDTENPELALKILMELLSDIRENGVTEKELENHKSMYLTKKYLGEESTLDQCNSLVVSSLREPSIRSTEFNSKIEGVSTAEVHQVLKKYLTNIYWTYLGNTELLSDTYSGSISKIGG